MSKSVRLSNSSSHSCWKGASPEPPPGPPYLGSLAAIGFTLSILNSSISGVIYIFFIVLSFLFNDVFVSVIDVHTLFGWFAVQLHAIDGVPRVSCLLSVVCCHIFNGCCLFINEVDEGLCAADCCGHIAFQIKVGTEGIDFGGCRWIVERIILQEEFLRVAFIKVSRFEGASEFVSII